MSEEQKASRWDAFSDEELNVLRDELVRVPGIEAAQMRAESAGTLRGRHLERKRLEEPSYRGPGIYVQHPYVKEWEVLGMIEAGQLVVFRDPLGGLCTVKREFFDEIFTTLTARGGKALRRFEYVRPLACLEEAS